MNYIALEALIIFIAIGGWLLYRIGYRKGYLQGRDDSMALKLGLQRYER